MLTGEFRPPEYDPNIITHDGLSHHNSFKRYSAYTLYSEPVMYHVRYSYELGHNCGFIDKIAQRQIDKIAQRQLAEGFRYIILNHIDPANEEVYQLIDLFKANNYPLVQFSQEFSSDIMREIHIDLGERNVFLAFIEQLKRKDARPVMPTETELLQFLSKGDD